MGCESFLSFLRKENGGSSSGPAARHRKSWKLETSGGLVRRRVDLLRNTLGGRGHFRGDLFTGLGCQFGCLAACLLHICRKSLHGARDKLGPGTRFCKAQCASVSVKSSSRLATNWVSMS